MSKKLFFLLKLISFALVVNSTVLAQEIKIFPLKKPILQPKVKENKISQNIIKPAPKPKIKIITEKETEIVPTAKPVDKKTQNENEVEVKDVTKKNEKI